MHTTCTIVIVPTLWRSVRKLSKVSIRGNCANYLWQDYILYHAACQLDVVLNVLNAVTDIVANGRDTIGDVLTNPVGVDIDVAATMQAKRRRHVAGHTH